MTITGPTPNYIIQTYFSRANQAESAVVRARSGSGRQADETKSDNIEFSDKIREMQKISLAMETEPADRKQKISDIKQQVATNQYTINAHQIAEKMIGTILDKQE